MGREYSRRAKQRNNGPQQLLLVVVTFLLGYLTASILDVGTISHWMNAQVLAHNQAQQPAKEVAKAQQQTQIPPKPKFEFYTLLANEKVPNQGQTATAAAMPTKASATAGRVATTVTAAQITHPTTPTKVAQAKVAQNVPKAVVASHSAPAKPVAIAASKVHYLVQVASFKARSDAEQMKGTLILKGFDVSVVAFSQANGNWFRVVVGPYANKSMAQQAQSSLARNERLRGMVMAVNG